MVLVVDKNAVKAWEWDEMQRVFNYLEGMLEIIWIKLERKPKELSLSIKVIIHVLGEFGLSMAVKNPIPSLEDVEYLAQWLLQQG